MNTERKEAEDKLPSLIKGMDVPARRKEDVRWLARNLGVRNSEHPGFQDACSHITMMMKKGWY